VSYEYQQLVEYSPGMVCYVLKHVYTAKRLACLAFGMGSCRVGAMCILVCASQSIWCFQVRFVLFCLFQFLLSVPRIPSGQMKISKAVPASPLSGPLMAAPQAHACSDLAPCASPLACALIPEPLWRHVDFALALSWEHLWVAPDLWWQHIELPLAPLWWGVEFMPGLALWWGFVPVPCLTIHPTHPFAAAS